ncbi:hypothetical protein [Phocaeicola sp.]
MNWYIYWHIAVGEYCKEICSTTYRSSSLLNVFTSVSLMFITTFITQVIGRSLSIPFLENYSLGIGLIVYVADWIFFYENSKRFQRWKTAYEKCRTDEKDLCCFLLGCIGFIGMLVILYTGFGTIKIKL